MGDGSLQQENVVVSSGVGVGVGGGLCPGDTGRGGPRKRSGRDVDGLTRCGGFVEKLERQRCECGRRNWSSTRKCGL